MVFPMLKHRRHDQGPARILIAVVLSAALLILPVDRAFAGRGDKSGTAAAPQLLIPVGAVSIALGGAGLATSTGIEAMYWNPAGLAREGNGTDVMFSHMSYLADISVEYAGVSTRLGSLGSVGLSMKSLAVGTIPVTTEDAPDGTGETASPTFLVVGGTFSRQISEKIFAGITANIIYESMDRVSASGVAFSAGVQYLGLGGIEGLSLGVAVKNVGPGMTYDGSGLLRNAEIGDASRGTSPVKIQAARADLPSTIEFGLGYSFALSDRNNLRISSVFQNNNYSEDEYRFGGEYLYDNLVALRAGMTISPQDAGNEYIYGPSGGLGIHTLVNEVRVSVDYAYRWVRYFSGNHVITLSVGF
jgi:hypothetical protein